jgi:microcystin-dependent protein
MSDPFVAEIRIFPFNFAPTGWAWCDGQLLPISQNTALFFLTGQRLTEGMANRISRCPIYKA